MGFLIFKARITFIQLKKAFIKELIMCYFNLKYYMEIKINVLSYSISRVFSQIILYYLYSNYVISKNSNLIFFKFEIY